MPTKVSETEISEIKRLYQEGLSFGKIAKQMNISSGTAWRYTCGEELGYSSFADYAREKAKERGYRGTRAQ